MSCQTIGACTHEVSKTCGDRKQEVATGCSIEAVRRAVLRCGMCVWLVHLTQGMPGAAATKTEKETEKWAPKLKVCPHP